MRDLTAVLESRESGRVLMNIKSPQQSPQHATTNDGRPLKWPRTVAQKSTRYGFNHRPLHTYMDINEKFQDYYRRPTFPKLFVTKLVVTQGTTRYQMKDMDIIFLLIPISLLRVKWFGYYSLSKSSIFSKCSKMLEIDNFYSQLSGNFFFLKAVIQR